MNVLVLPAQTDVVVPSTTSTALSPEAATPQHQRRHSGSHFDSQETALLCSKQDKQDKTCLTTTMPSTYLQQQQQQQEGSNVVTTMQQVEEASSRSSRRHRRRHTSSAGVAYEATDEKKEQRKSKSSSSKRRSSKASSSSESSQSFFSAVQKSLAAAQDDEFKNNKTSTTPEVVHRPVAMRIARPTAQRIAPPRRSSSTQSLPDLSSSQFENVNPNIPNAHDTSATPQHTAAATTTFPPQQEQPQAAAAPQAQAIPVPMAMMMMNFMGMQQQLQQNNNSWNNVPRRRKKKRSPEQKYQMIKASWYHSIAAKNRLGAIGEDPVVFSDSDREHERKRHMTPLSRLNMMSEQQLHAKRALLKELNDTKGDLKTQAFQAALQQLLELYDATSFDPRKRPSNSTTTNTTTGNVLEGVGISAGKPTFPGCIGYNPQGDPMYKLGTMSFDMFCPTQLVMSVQGTFVLIDSVDPKDSEKVKHVPSNLMEQVRCGSTPVRTYNIVTPCTIEPYQDEFGPDSPNKGIEQPIRGVMTTFGYILPYPKGSRFSVWFTGGTLELDGNKNEKWFQIFDKDTAPKRSFVESGKVFAAKLLMGASTNDTMDAQGKLSYTLSRPMASHIDLIYLDQRMQIFRGSSGTVYVHVRIPGSLAVQTCNQSNDLIPAPRDPCADDDEDDDDDDDSTEGDFDDGLFHHFPHHQRHSQQQQVQPTMMMPMMMGRSYQQHQPYSSMMMPAPQCLTPQYVQQQQPTPQQVQCMPQQQHYAPQYAMTTTPNVVAAPKPRRVASDSDLQNLVPGKIDHGRSSGGSSRRSSSSSSRRKSSGSSRSMSSSSSSSCLKTASAYEAPKRAWYLDSEVAKIN